MEELRKWAFSVAVTVVFGTVAEIAMPEGDYKKYIHIVLGMILLLNLTAPITALVSNGGGSLIEEYAAGIDSAVRGTETDAAEIESMQRDEIVGIYKNTLEDRIADEIEKRCGTAPISVEAEIGEGDDLSPELVTVRMPNGASAGAEAVEAASEITGLTADKIILEET